MNQCETYEVLISAALDGDLSIDESAELDVHMGECSGCRALLSRFEQVDLLVAGHDLELPTTQTKFVDNKPQLSQDQFWKHATMTGVPVIRRESTLMLSKPITQTSFRKKRSTSGRFHIRQAMVTAGTLAAVGVAAFLVNSGTKPPAESVEVYDFVTPVSQITRLNQRSKDAQRNLADTYEFELRLLKVQTVAAKSNLPIEKHTEFDNLTSRIEALRKKLRNINTTPSL